MPPKDTLFISTEKLAWQWPDGERLFNELDLTFNANLTGLVGANGAGKSTLLDLLAGQALPAAGRVRSNASIGLLRQSETLSAEARVVDLLGHGPRWEAFLRLERGEPRDDDVERLEGWWDLPDRLATALRDFGLETLSLTAIALGLSGGEQTCCRLAGLLLAAPDFLLLDEPTNHLDETRRAILLERLASWPGKVVVASHDRDLLESANEIVALGDASARQYRGNYSAYEMQRAAEQNAAAQALDHERREKRRLAAAVQESRERHQRRASRGARSRSRGDMPKILLDARKGRSETTGARLKAVAAARVAQADARVAEARERVASAETLRVRPPEVKLAANKRLLEFDGVQLPAGSSVYANEDRLTWTLRGSARAWIRGGNGAGKSTLLDLVTGHAAPPAGAIRRHLSAADVARLDQHAAILDPHRNVLENFITMSGVTDTARARIVLADFLFTGDSPLRAVGGLSGGERMRAGLACALYRKQPPLLVCLDEPTNHLDIASIEAIERALFAWGGALLVVTHDARFAQNLALTTEINL